MDSYLQQYPGSFTPVAQTAVLHRLQRSRSDAAPEREPGWIFSRDAQLLDRVEEEDGAAAFAADHLLTDTLQRRFEVYAQTNPGTVAVSTSALQLTFGELDAQADGLAVLLQQRGVGPGRLCVIDIAPSLALPRALLAVLKAGAIAALPGIDTVPSAPQDASAGSRQPLRLTADAASSMAGMAADPLHCACAEDGSDLPYAWPQEYPIHRLSPAFVLRAATGDGAARLAIRSHLAIIGHLMALQRVHALGHGDALLLNSHVTPSTFPWELLWPLSQGARLVVPTSAELEDASQLRRLIRRERITVMHLVPALRSLLRQAPEECDGLDSLRAVFCLSRTPGEGALHQD